MNVCKIILFCSVFSLAFVAVGVQAAIGFDNATSVNTGSATATTRSWSHTVSGAERVLVVGVSINGNRTVSSVTYGGVNLTRIATIAQGTAARASLWYLANPSQGTNTITVTMSGTARFVAGAHSYTGVNTSNPIGTPVTNNSGSGLTGTVNVSSAFGELVVDVIARRGDLTTNPLNIGSGQTQQWNNRTTINNINSGVTGGGSSKPGAGTTAMSWTWPSSRAWAIAAVSLKPVPPPGDTTPPLRFNGLPSGVLSAGTTQSNLSVQTDENATCKYDTAAGVAYGSMANTFQTTGVQSHSQSITGLSDGQAYNFYIKCSDSVGNANGDDFLVAFEIETAPPPPPDTEAPLVPVNVTADAISSSQINSSWDASSDNVGVTGYKVFQNSVFLTTTTDTFYFDTGLNESTDYSYTVLAYDAAGNESAQSSAAHVRTFDPPPPPPPDPDTTPPSVPENVSASAVSGFEISITWDGSTDDNAVAGYNVFRDGNFVTQVVTTQYSDFGLQESTTYFYTISAVDTSSNESAESSLANARTFDPPPPPPPDPNDTTPPLRFNGLPSGVLPAGTTQATLSFGTDENATCKYDTATGIAYGSMAHTFQTTGGVLHEQILSSVIENINYAYYVRCQDSTSNSNDDDFEIAFSVAPQIDTEAPSVPSGLTLQSISSTEVRFSWSASADNVGVEGYKVFRNGAQVGSTGDTEYAGVGVVQLTTYSFTVLAYDAAGNESAQSDALVVTTLAFNAAPLVVHNTSTDTLSDSLSGNAVSSLEADDQLEEAGVQEEGIPEGMQGAEETGEEPLFTKPLFFGVRHQQVVLLQHILFKELLLGSAGRITGYFGDVTKTAVQKFQCAQQIVCEGDEASTGYGRVGPKTRVALNTLVDERSNLREQLYNISSKFFSVDLYFGMQHEDVRRLQEFLSRDVSIYPEALVTGYFGNLTKRAVQRFQCDQQIICTGDEASTGYGRVGPKTRTALYKGALE